MWKMLSLVNFLACDAVQQLLGKSRRGERVGGSCTLIYVLHATTLHMAAIAAAAALGEAGVNESIRGMPRHRSETDRDREGDRESER